MLMNGEEVNHLVVGGETFDKSYSAGVKAKVVAKGGYAEIGSIKKDGTIVSGMPGGGGYAKTVGDIVTVIAIYKNAAAFLASDTALINTGSWIYLDNLEFINDTTGGVNSPFYLLLLYLLIALLAWEVAFLC